jgi:hypothetical protein
MRYVKILSEFIPGVHSKIFNNSTTKGGFAPVILTPDTNLEVKAKGVK